MNVEAKIDSASEGSENMDRQTIHVGMHSTQAGITAALRRAFQTAAAEPSDRDFADLLRRLN
jgi:hypothetical protein